jgi:hypothetical protein
MANQQQQTKRVFSTPTYSKIALSTGTPQKILSFNELRGEIIILTKKNQLPNVYLGTSNAVANNQNFFWQLVPGEKFIDNAEGMYVGDIWAVSEGGGITVFTAEFEFE